jgi:hypothetical protein
MAHFVKQIGNFVPEATYGGHIATPLQLYHRRLQLPQRVQALPPVQLPDLGVANIDEVDYERVQVLGVLEEVLEVPAGRLKVHTRPSRRRGLVGDQIALHC